MQPEPLVECIYGWGRELRLYPDYLDLDGTLYALSELVHVHAIYHRIIGIPSVRLELRFKRIKRVIRGIAAVEDAYKMVGYLSSRYAQPEQCLSQGIMQRPPAEISSKRADAIQNSHEHGYNHDGPPATEEGAFWQKTGELPLGIVPAAALLTMSSTQLVLGEPEYVYTGYDRSLREAAQALTTPIEIPYKQRAREEQRAHRKVRQQTERSIREHGFDVEKLARMLQNGMLPAVSVPIRLQSGEYAHYSTDATRCREPLRTAKRYTYIARDHGVLILTSERMIYIGRRSQIVLSYARLLHVSRLRGAIAFMADHWSRREIFELQRPLECTMYLEYILQRFQVRNAVAVPYTSMRYPRTEDAYLGRDHIYTLSEQQVYNE
jgi:hypothetical protein